MGISKFRLLRVPNGEAVSNHVVVVVSGLWSVGPFFILWWWGFNPWLDLIEVPFSVVGWWDSNPWRVTVL